MILFFISIYMIDGVSICEIYTMLFQNCICNRHTQHCVLADIIEPNFFVFYQKCFLEARVPFLSCQFHFSFNIRLFDVNNCFISIYFIMAITACIHMHFTYACVHIFIKNYKRKYMCYVIFCRIRIYLWKIALLSHDCRIILLWIKDV